MTIPPAPHPKPIKTTSSSSSSPSLTREPSSSRASFESFMSDDEDIFMTIETRHEPEFVAVEPPSLTKTTNYDDNRPESREKERQISIDPMSIRAPNIRQASFRLVSPPPSTTIASKSSSPDHNNTIPLPQPPPRLKFLNSTDSLPLPAGSSTSSSPEPIGGSSLLKNKVWKSESDIVVSTQLRGGTNLSQQRSSMDDTQLLLEERRRRSMRRNMISISGDQGRSSGTTAPAVVDDFELCLYQKPIDRERKYYNNNNNNNNNNNSFEQAADHHHDFRTADGSRTRWSSKKGSRKNSRNQQLPPIDDRFNKCGKLCLFLPRGKGKPAVRSASTVSTVSSTASTAAVGFSLASSQKRTTYDDDDNNDNNNNNNNNNHHHNSHPAVLASISRRVSLEKFECGSWSSASLLNDYDDDGDVDSASLFFDLPDEMIRCSVSDMQSPVTAAFLFDGKQDAVNDE